MTTCPTRNLLIPPKKLQAVSIYDDITYSKYPDANRFYLQKSAKESQQV